MKKIAIVVALSISFLFMSFEFSSAQCSICTKTTQQLGEKPAKGLNGGILYLAFTPFAVAAFVGYRWWKSNRQP